MGGVGVRLSEISVNIRNDHNSFGLPSDSITVRLLLAQLGLRKPIQKKGLRYAWSQTMANHWFPSSYGQLQKISF